MTNEKTNPGSASGKRKRQLDVVYTQLISQAPSDIWNGMNQIRKWLQEDIEDQGVYGLLLNVVQENHDLRVQIRNLFVAMVQKGSKSAVQALSLLPSSLRDLLADADDAYYAAEYDQAIQLYRDVLRIDPENERAKDHLAKAEIKRRAEDLETGLPRAAVQYYRRARSYIAARDVSMAINLLSAAVETAQVADMEYPDAENALSNMQNLLTADEYKQKADIALNEQRWKYAVDLFSKAQVLDPTNVVTAKELESLQGLLRAESELKGGSFTKIFIPTGQLQKILTSAKGIISSNNPLLIFVDRRLNQIRLIRTSIVSIACIAAALFIGFTISNEKSEFFEFHKFPGMTVSTNTPIFIASDIPTKVMTTATGTGTETVIPSPTASQTLTPTPTSTLIPTATIKPLAYGSLEASFFYPYIEPNGIMQKTAISRNQFLIIVAQTENAGDVWYKCLWEVNGKPSEGWVLGKKIKIIPAPTPTPTQ